MMPSQKALSLIGWLKKVDDENNKPSGTNTYDIREGEELLVGRHPSSHLIFKDPIISNRHLKIYSVIYDDEPREFFVYAQDLSTNGSYWQYKRGSHREESLIGRGNAVLLSSGDRIRLSDGTLLVFWAAATLSAGPLLYVDDVQQREIESFSNLYQLTDRQLGAGAFARVVLAIDCFRCRQMACKIVKLSEPRWFSEADASKLWREVKLLKDISHPNIIHIERVFYTEFNIYIIEDLIAGGDLRSYLDQKDGPLADADASMIVYQILKALKYLHGLKIAHRDIKPENVLMSFPAVDARIILADFGQSIKASMTRMYTWVGTVDYVAPEVNGLNPRVYKIGYTIAADMWSLGALTTTLFLKRPYFTDTQDTSIRQGSTTKITEAAAMFDLGALDDSPSWENVHKQAKDFIKRLLVLQEVERATVGEAIQDTWFKAGDDGKSFEKRYQHIIRGWTATLAAQDFLENLEVFMAVRKKTTDLQAMPPPPKPGTSVALSKDQASPYFNDPKAKLPAFVNAAETDEKENTVNTTKTANHLFKRPTSGSHGHDTAPSQSSSKIVPSQEFGSINVEHERAASPDPIDHVTDTCSPQDDEISLYLEVGGQQKGFRSAKRFASAIAARKKMKEL